MAEELKCQNCGKGFIPTCHITRQKFCSGGCRIEWWREYHKANPPEDEQAKECAMCGAPLTGKNRGRKYCSRFCYLLAVDRGHSEEICEWCGEKFLDSSGQGRRYCSRSCSVSARYTRQGVRRGKRRAQSGSYPWPAGQTGEAVEISEKEFEYLLGKSIVPFKAKKGCDG